jgi:hypothetical protein
MASTRAGQFKGKLSYMAPEQASTSETDQRSDLFSVGIILWESLTGRRLFKGETNAATLNKLLNDAVMKPSSLWPELEPYDEVVMKALNRNPDDRFQSADEFGEALDLAAGRGDVAKTRDVAEVVRALDAEKLRDERHRVRHSIELLGRAEFAESKVPMPREGGTPASQTYSRNDASASYTHGSISGVINDGTAVVRESAGSNVLRWLVMLLAIVVFLYAGFLVWQLLQTPTPSMPPMAPRLAAEPALAPELPATPTAAPKLEPTPVETTPESSGLDTAPERKSSTKATRSRRRRQRPKGPTAAKRASEPQKPSQEAPTTPAPQPDPVDIDIRNPYRN